MPAARAWAVQFSMTAFTSPNIFSARETLKRSATVSKSDRRMSSNFPFTAHQVLARPFAFGIMGVRHVIGRGQFPPATLLEEKRKVLGMVVQLRAITLKAIRRNACVSATSPKRSSLMARKYCS